MHKDQYLHKNNNGYGLKLILDNISVDHQGYDCYRIVFFNLFII